MTDLKIRIFLLMVDLLFAGINLKAQDPFIQKFTTSDGLPSNTVYKIFQDSKKFMWFATDAGLAKYDGTRFNYYRIQEGLSSNDVVDIKEDSFGRIWLFHSDGSLNYYKDNAIFNEKNTPCLMSLKSSDYFSKMSEDKYQNIFFYNNLQREIYMLDPGNQVKKYQLPSIISKNDISKGTIESMSVRYMCRNEKDEFIFWTTAGCYKTRHLSEKPVLITDAYRFKDVIVSSNNQKYILTRKKNSKKIEVKRFNDDFIDNETNSFVETTTDKISSILEENNGLLWISTSDKGVDCFKGGKIFYHLEIKDAKSIIQDQERNIWVCSAKEGVFRISPYFYQHKHLGRSVFGNSGIYGLSKNDSMGIWCTNGKTAYLIRDDGLYTLDFQNKENSFNQILQVPQNTLLIGETGQKPFMLEGIRLNQTEKKISIKKKAQSVIVLEKIVYNRSKNRTSSFNQMGVVFTLDPFEYINRMKMLKLQSRIFNAYYNARDELIINSKRNFIYANKTAIASPDLSFLKGRIVTGHLNITDQNEVFCMNDDSLFLLNNKRLYNLTAVFDRPIDFQVKHLEYQDSTLIIATSRNIFVCDNPVNILKNKPVFLHMVNINFNSIHGVLFHDSKLYVASDDGLTTIPYNALLETSDSPPIPYFQSIRVNDHENLINQNQISLVSSQRINIAFYSINYYNSPVTYSYKLVGTDTDWTIVKGNNVVLQNLTKGTYNFMLRARKPASPWSEPISFGIDVRATLWQNPFFYFFVVLLFGGLVFLVVLRQKNEELNRRKMEHQIVLLEQKSLQAMMNPHFIFNSLGSIQNYLLQHKPHEASVYLAKFARLIRQNFNAINTSLIYLEEEIDRLKNYLDLEKLRLGDKFEYNIVVDENVESEDILIPSMIIQPFVENAIWHGIANLEEKGELDVLLKMRDEESLQIIVSDSGVGINNAEKFSSNNQKHLNLGINITRKRLVLLGQKYGTETSISYSERLPDAPNPGTIVTIIVPVHFGTAEQSVQTDTV